VNTKMSLAVKYVILCVFVFGRSGLFGPVWWRCSSWVVVVAAIANDIRKCSAKGDGITGEWRRLHNEELTDLY
jgi:hypothetical protein